jgi:hypothetical protein
MKEPASDRWQLIVVGTFLTFLALGVYFAQRKTSSITNDSIFGKKHEKSPRAKARTTNQRLSSSESGGKSRVNGRNAVTTSDAAVTSALECDAIDEHRPSLKNRSPVKDALSFSIRLVDTDRKAAAEALRTLEPSPLGDAYLALLLFDSDQKVEGTQRLTHARLALQRPQCQLALPDPNPQVRDDDMKVAFRTLRLVLEDYVNDPYPGPIACSLFRSHPLESTLGFSVLWGTSRDNQGKLMKDHCVERTLHEVSPKHAQRYLSAQRNICSALLTVAAIPKEGFYQSVYTAACDLIRDAILAPELTSREHENEVTHSLENWIAQKPELSPRIARFNAILAKDDQDLAKAICAVLASRNQGETIEKCQKRAKGVAYEALVSWLSAVNDAHSTPNNGLHEPAAVSLEAAGNER